MSEPKMTESKMTEPEIQVFKNGKVILRWDGIEVRTNPTGPFVHLVDRENRYAFFVGEGVALHGAEADAKIQLLKKWLLEYLHWRGQRTGWTPNDAWKRKWEAKRARPGNP